MDSWIYPALDDCIRSDMWTRLSLGSGRGPRLSIAHMLEESADRIDTGSE